MRIVNADGKQHLQIGHQGENMAVAVVFDLAPYIGTCGAGTAALLVQRHGDNAPYPVIITQDGNIARWTVSNLDTAVSGMGMAELRWFVGDIVAKSSVYTITVSEGLGTETTPPEPYDAWIDELLAIATTAETAAINAGTSATAAEQSKAAAETAATDAGTSAAAAEQSKAAAETALDLKAPLESPALTGMPTAPTAAEGTDNTQIATTAFVKSAAADAVAKKLPIEVPLADGDVAAIGISSKFARADHVHPRENLFLIDSITSSKYEISVENGRLRYEEV